MAYIVKKTISLITIDDTIVIYLLINKPNFLLIRKRNRTLSWNDACASSCENFRIAWNWNLLSYLRNTYSRPLKLEPSHILRDHVNFKLRCDVTASFNPHYSVALNGVSKKINNRFMGKFINKIICNIHK